MIVVGIVHVFNQIPYSEITITNGVATGLSNEGTPNVSVEATIEEQCVAILSSTSHGMQLSDTNIF